MPEHERQPRNVSDTVAALEAKLDGYVAPHAYAVGVATVGPSGGVLDVSFPHVNCDESWGTAVVLAASTGHREGTASYRLDQDTLDDAIADLSELATGDGPHLNLDAWTLSGKVAALPALGGERVVVACLIDNLYQPPVDTIDAYLRLHLLSHRKMIPNSMNLNGLFGLLNTVVWTNLGPFEPENFEMTRMALRADGHNVEVNLVDKFPRMLDYVVPSGVRIADANRVRMGAYLSEGTVVMHEGFCNFNAGTLGSSHGRRPHQPGCCRGRTQRHRRWRIHHGHTLWWRHRRRVGWQEQPDRRQRRYRHLHWRRLHRRSRLLHHRWNSRHDP